MLAIKEEMTTKTTKTTKTKDDVPAKTTTTTKDGAPTKTTTTTKEEEMPTKTTKKTKVVAPIKKTTTTKDEVPAKTTTKEQEEQEEGRGGFLINLARLLMLTSSSFYFGYKGLDAVSAFINRKKLITSF